MTKPVNVPEEFAHLDEPSMIVPGLYMGWRPDSYAGYDLVINCEQHLTAKPRKGWDGMLIHLPLQDAEDFEIPSDLVNAAAGVASGLIQFRNQAGYKVLVHCTGGFNRSGLVTAAILKKLGFGGRAAVDVIRTQRHEWCLHNRAFERWVTGEALPTAETSAFRQALVDDEAEFGPVPHWLREAVRETWDGDVPTVQAPPESEYEPLDLSGDGLGP